MLQIDHIYEFLSQNIFKDFDSWSLPNGGSVNINQIDSSDIVIFTLSCHNQIKILFYDQEPFINNLSQKYIDVFTWENRYSIEELINIEFPYGFSKPKKISLDFLIKNPNCIHKKSVLVTSEYSDDVDDCSTRNNFYKLYYFFHGFAALDWYRGHYALNYNKSIVKQYKNDFISFNRIILNDRSYRIYFVSLLKELGLLDNGLVSFNVTDNLFNDWRDEAVDPNTKLSAHAKQHAKQHLVDIDKLVIDYPELSGSASADIPRSSDSYTPPEFHKPVDVDAFWHVVTETVFYYDKLHLTEKIFKPIVSKQPFMLLAAPGNLAYLKSYGFKTFDSVIDETYDTIQDNDSRIEAVVKQLHWYCNLTPGEKTDVIKQLESIIDYNFHHFYGEFRHIIARELLDNTKVLFQELGYNDSHIDYSNIHHVLTN